MMMLCKGGIDVCCASYEALHAPPHQTSHAFLFFPSRSSFQRALRSTMEQSMLDAAEYRAKHFGPTLPEPFFDCFTIIFLAFRGKVNHHGPTNPRARQAWERLMDRLISASRSITGYRNTCWATVMNDAFTIVVFISTSRKSHCIYNEPS